MGRPKLTNHQVEVIKHLIQTKQLPRKDISDLFGVQLAQISRISRNMRWDNIPTPDSLRGEYLYLKYLNGKLDNE